jgi:hypothetical protein
MCCFIIQIAKTVTKKNIIIIFFRFKIVLYFVLFMLIFIIHRKNENNETNYKPGALLSARTCEVYFLSFGKYELCSQF